MTDHAAISAFVDRVQVAKNYNSKEIRLTIEEADGINLEITQMLLRLNEFAKKVIDLQTKLMSGVEVRQDGGGF